MRYAIIADIHANLHALQAVLDALGDAAPDRTLVAGDLVGYGAFPNECVELVAELDAVCIAGNHDLIAIDRLSSARCIPLARDSLAWTAQVLDDSSRRYLEALPLVATADDGVVLAHGTLDDPQTYTTRRQDADLQLDEARARFAGAAVLVLGHTHHAWWSCRTTGSAAIVEGRPMQYEPGEQHLLNPGSVGQSREPRAWARYAILDTSARAATFYAIDYDVAACRSALARRGLSPRSYHLKPSTLRRSVRAMRAAVQGAQGR